MTEPFPLYLGSTALKEAFECLALYDYHQNQKLILKPSGVRYPVRRGVWCHTALEHWHKELDWQEAIAVLSQWAKDQHVELATVELVATETTRIVEDYIAFHRGKRFEVVSSERTYELAFPGANLVLAPTLDLLVREQGELWVVEIKTTKNIPDATWRAVDPQTAQQILAVDGQVGPVKGAIFDYVYTGAPSIPRVTKGDKNNPPWFYANTAQTTNRCFGLGVEALKLAWDTYHKGNGWEHDAEKLRQFNEYVANARLNLVQDGKFFQRAISLRSDQQILTTMMDVRVKVEEIRLAQRLGHWPHSFGTHCLLPSPCFYQEVCAREYILGREATSTREELYMHDDGTREGRFEVEAHGQRFEVFREWGEDEEG